MIEFEYVFRETTKYSTGGIKMRPASANKMAYGIHKPHKKGDPGEIIDKCMDLEKENLTLKEKENLLERELTK